MSTRLRSSPRTGNVGHRERAKEAESWKPTGLEIGIIVLTVAIGARQALSTKTDTPQTERAPRPPARSSFDHPPQEIPPAPKRPPKTPQQSEEESVRRELEDEVLNIQMYVQDAEKNLPHWRSVHETYRRRTTAPDYMPTVIFNIETTINELQWMKRELERTLKMIDENSTLHDRVRELIERIDALLPEETSDLQTLQQ